MQIKFLVTRVINEWDPVGFLAGGAPNDEYDIEIEEIVNQLHTCTSFIDIAKIFQTVFYNQLCVKLNTLDCCIYAIKLYEEMDRQ